MQRKWILPIGAVIVVTILAAVILSYSTEPVCTFRGTVVSVPDDAVTTEIRTIVIEVAEDDEMRRSGARYVRIGVHYYDALKDMEFSMGELVEVTYSGGIMETGPAQLGKVISITKIAGGDEGTDPLPVGDGSGG